MNTAGQSLNQWKTNYREREKELTSLGGLLPEYRIGWYITATEFYAAANVQIGTDSVAYTPQADTANVNLVYTDAAVADRIKFRGDASGTGDLVGGLKIGDIIYYTVGSIPDAGVILSIQSASDSDIDGNTENVIVIRRNRRNIGPVGTALVNGSDFQIQSFHRANRDYEQNTRDLTTIQLCWCPPLSVFDLQNVIPCAGTKHEITLTPYPDTVFQKNIIESRGTDKTHGASGDFLFEIIDMRLYILTCDSNTIQDNFEFMLDLDEVQCQTQPIISLTQQHTLDVVGSCNGIAIAFQDEAARTNTLYPLSKFKIRDDLELNVTRYYIRYEGQVPQPDFDGELSLVNRTDTLLDIYNRTKIYDGSMFKDSVETVEEYRNRGMYIYHPFPKTASSRNTRVYTQVNFSSLTADQQSTQTNPLLLLFQFYKKVVVCKVSNGRIIQVTPIDA